MRHAQSTPSCCQLKAFPAYARSPDPGAPIAGHRRQSDAWRPGARRAAGGPAGAGHGGQEHRPWRPQRLRFASRRRHRRTPAPGFECQGRRQDHPGDAPGERERHDRPALLRLYEVLATSELRYDFDNGLVFVPLPLLRTTSNWHEAVPRSMSYRRSGRGAAARRGGPQALGRDDRGSRICSASMPAFVGACRSRRDDVHSLTLSSGRAMNWLRAHHAVRVNRGSIASCALGAAPARTVRAFFLAVPRLACSHGRRQPASACCLPPTCWHARLLCF